MKSVKSIPLAVPCVCWDFLGMVALKPFQDLLQNLSHCIHMLNTYLFILKVDLQEKRERERQREITGTREREKSSISYSSGAGPR